MHTIKRRIIGLLLAGILLSTSACNSANPINSIFGSKEKSYSSEDKLVQSTFDDYTETMFLESVVEDTITLHYTLKDPVAFGITEYTPTLGTISLEEFKSYATDIQEAKTELEAFSRDSLTSQQRLTYDILTSHFQTESKVSGMELYTEYLNPTTGIQAQLPVLLAEYEFNNERDVTDYIAILSDLDTYYSQIIEFEKLKSQNGLFMSDRILDDILKGCESFISEADDNYLIEVFDERIDALEGISDDTKASYKEQNRASINDHVIPAYQLLIFGLNELRSTGVNDKGLFYFDQGQEYYEYLVESKVGSSHSPEELLTLVENRMNNDINKLSTVIGKYPTVVDQSTTFTYSTYDPNEIMEELKVKVKDNFPEIPEIAYNIKYVHPSLEDSLSPAFYLTPPIDDSNRNVIYINKGSLAEDSSGLYTTLAHEGYPGHLYQNVYFNQVNTCNLRRILPFTGYSEGWATYVEFDTYQLAEGMDPNTAKFLSASASANLAFYAYLDISINYLGWDITDTKEILQTYYGIDDDEVAADFFYAMVADPANYLNYYVGYLEIMELKDSLKKKLGKNFVLKDFHEQLLNIGPAPFGVIDIYLNEWADTVK